jgi:hypothetical protein
MYQKLTRRVRAFRIRERLFSVCGVRVPWFWALLPPMPRRRA